MKKLLIFDYDNTLAQPVSVPPNEILFEVARLLKENYLAVISGGRTLEQMKKLFVKNIPVKNNDFLKHLFICPLYGNKVYCWNNKGFDLMYETEGMTQEEKNEIYDVLRNLEGIEKAEIKKREEYISLDCLGGSASKEERERWDPNGNKRLVIRGRLDELLKGRFDLFMAGRATIDIVAKGKNKADNTVRLAKVLNIPLKDVIFTGDEFRVYGNDYPLLSLKDIQVNIVNNPEETLEIIKKM